MKTYKKSLLNLVIAGITLSLTATGCSSDFLDQESDQIFTAEEVFSDPEMILSALAEYYRRADYNVNLDNFESNGKRYVDYGVTDEASNNESNPNETTFPTDAYREYNYGYLRNINQFLANLRATTVLKESDKLGYEAEVRFIRAWAYFNMARGLGGLAIVGDQVFGLEDDVEKMRIARSTEDATYQYIIDELDWCASNLTAGKRVNNARANKWVALALKARAAITAASLAKYNNLVTPEIKTEGGEVGISAERAEHFYNMALDAANEIINDGPYSLFKKYSDPSENYYHLFIDKTDNPEVMWVKDYKLKDKPQYWAAGTCPNVVSFGSTNRCCPLLNLVEAYEYLDNRDGSLKIYDDKGGYVYYENPSDIFANKDGRLKGTVICNGDIFATKEIIYQAGQIKQQNKKWKKTTSAPGITDVDGDIITSENGPRSSTTLYDNTTGFSFRKYSEEDDAKRSPSSGSDTWFVYFRLAEIKLIRAEALLELGRAAEGLADINDIRTRAGLKELTSYNILDIEQECRVEFPLEEHRWWDLKRWRRSHVIWDGESDSSIQWVLFPYRIKDLRSKNNGQWVYERQPNNRRPNARKFEYRNYYNPFSSSWLANNPLLVKNPYQ